MHLLYLNDSRDEATTVFVAVMIREDAFRAAYDAVRAFRATLRAKDGIHPAVALRAAELVAGRSRLGPAAVPKARRRAIFLEALRLLAGLPGVAVVDVVRPAALTSDAFEAILAAVQGTLERERSHAVCVADVRKKSELLRLTRRVRGINAALPERFAASRDSGGSRANVPATRIVEDMVFKPLQRSAFVQLAAFAAFARLRQVAPPAHPVDWGLASAFDVLKPIVLASGELARTSGALRPP